MFTFHAWLNAGSPSLRLPIVGLDVTPLARFGWLGVDVFFVLSGFLLTRQAFARLRERASTEHGVLAREFGDKYRTYVRRRIVRVYPAYYATLAVLLALAAARIYQEVPGRLDLLMHLPMMHNAIERYIATIDGPFWTLPFEWHFYLVFPWLFVLLRRHGARVLYAGAIGGVLVAKAIVMATHDGYAQLWLPIRLDAFAAACAAVRTPPRMR